MAIQAPKQDIPKWLLDLETYSGYSQSTQLPDGSWCALFPYLFTTGLMVGLVDGDNHYHRRYCYEHHQDAARALLEWDGVGHPSGPWIKCKGSGIDLLNPNISPIE